MSSAPLLVVSTGYRARTAEACRTSVFTQSVQARHVYVEASLDRPPRPSLFHLWRHVVMVPRETIVVWLDGDDWLAHDRVLENVLTIYEACGPWLTYGSFKHADGNSSFLATEYEDPTKCRQDAWRATHLRTFRAGLFQRVRQRHLQRDGEWVRWATDMAVMFPMLEMAGKRRALFVPEVLCVYAGSNTPEEERPQERETERYLRGLAPYRTVEEL